MDGGSNKISFFFSWRPFLIPETTNQGVCISLAYCASSDDIVVSYRPRVEMSNEVVSQPLLTPSPATGQGVLGSHLHLKRVGSNYERLGVACSTVSDIRLPKSSIIYRQNQKPLFATGDEVSCGLILRELPSFTVTQRLRSHKHFIHDVKYTSTHSQGLLGCLSEDTVQLFSTKLSWEGSLKHAAAMLLLRVCLWTYFIHLNHPASSEHNGFFSVVYLQFILFSGIDFLFLFYLSIHRHSYVVYYLLIKPCLGHCVCLRSVVQHSHNSDLEVLFLFCFYIVSKAFSVFYVFVKQQYLSSNL